MVEALGFWTAPLLLIPGKGLLTISSGAQSGGLSESWLHLASNIVVATSCIGVGCLLAAAFFLVAEVSVSAPARS